jgi:hypothetical protein
MPSFSDNNNASNNKISKILKQIDYFGIQFNFHYKGRDKYNSVLSGIAFIIFILITIFYIFYSLFSFINHQVYTVTYYDILTAKANKVDFKKYSLSFAYGLTCSGYTAKQLDEYFYITPSHMTRETVNGTVNKTQVKFNNTFCNESDFYNKLNSSFNELKLSNYYCVPNNFSIEGVYVDNIFSYYQFVISAKKTSPEEYKNYYRILRGDCKFEIYYIDHIIDVNDYNNPLESSIEQIFMQLSPVNYKKMNVYFRQQEFSTDNDYLFDMKKTKIYGGYSRYEEYSLYLGPERFDERIANYYAFGTIYVRADRNKRIISRRYQKLTEFAASCSSLLSQLLLWMFVFFSFLNRFYANQSLIKNIFQIRNTKSIHFNQLKNFFDNLTGSDKKFIKCDEDNSKNKLFGAEDSKYIKIYSIKKLLNVSNNNENQNNYTVNNHENNNNDNINNVNNNYNNFNNKSFCCNNAQLQLQEKNKININFHNSNNINNKIPTYFTQNTPKNVNYNSNKSYEELSMGTIKQTLKKDKIFNKKFSLNCCELCIYKISCHKIYFCSKIKINNMLYEKAKKMLNVELDILNYLKHTQIIDLINYILLEKNQSCLLKFISKPSISLANKVNFYQKIRFYDNYNSDFDDFEKNLRFLVGKKEKTHLEKKLLNLVEMEINNLIN